MKTAINSAHSKASVIYVLALMLSACGGGSSSTPDATPQSSAGPSGLIVAPVVTVPTELADARVEPEAPAVIDPTAPETSPTPVTPAPGQVVPTQTPIPTPPFQSDPAPPAGTTLASFINSNTQEALAAKRVGQQRIGANIGWVRPFGRNHEYVDLVMQSGGFGSPGRYGTSNAPLGADGWPTGDFSIELMSAQGETRNLGGAYTVVYDGEATVNVLVSKISLVNKRKDAATGKWLIDLNFPAGAANMGLDFILTKGPDGKPIAPVKNLQVIRPGYDWRAPPIFTKPFLDHVRRFAVLRFMDWLDTNQEAGMAKGPEGIWANRPTAITKRTGTGSMVPRGQPWERISQLSNETGVDIWINVPPAANEEYFSELAKFFYQGNYRLTKGQRIYVEYGNEMWNGSFLQSQAIWNDALTEVKAGSTLGKRLNYDGTYVPGLKDANGNLVNQDGTKYKLGWRLYADRLVRISNAFRTVFNDPAMNTVRPVMAWQIVTPATTQVIMDYVQNVYQQPPHTVFHALAGAPYYGISKENAIKAADLRKLAEAAKLSDPAVDLDASIYTVPVAEMLADMAVAVQEMPVVARFEANVLLARKYKLKWIAYEGGPDTFGIASAKNKAQANREAAMFDICQSYLNNWALSGGGLFMWFQSGAGPWDGAYGSWPLVESITDVKGPKTVCMDWASITKPPMAISRHPLPGTLNPAEAVRFNGATGAEALLPVDSLKRLYLQGSERDYVVSTSAAACFKVTLNATNQVYDGTNSMPLEIWVNGDKQTSAMQSLETKFKLNDTRDFALGSVCLPAGVSALTLKLVANGSQFVMNSLSFQP